MEHRIEQLERDVAELRKKLDDITTIRPVDPEVAAMFIARLESVHVALDVVEKRLAQFRENKLG